MKNKKTKLSRAFQRWLLILVIIAALVTIAFLWLIQTRLSENNAISLLELNLADVRQDIIDASDENLLKLTRSAAQDINAADHVDGTLLSHLREAYDVTEINIIDSFGVITATTHPEFLGFDMHSGPQSAEFLVLLSGEDEYVQSYQPISYDADISRKYGGVALEDGGFVQVGYGSERFQRDIDEFVVGVTRNRHVGEGGCITIADEEGIIVSDRYGNEGQNLEATGIRIDTASMPENQVFVADAYGQPSYCMFQMTEGYLIVAVMPCSEAALSRNVSVGVTMAMLIMVFAALFIMIFVLVKRLVVNNIYQINDSLSAITRGNLDTVVNVRSHVEFDELSNDINSTVDTLKRYIADAAARIDAELALAKAIQYSALPSVFPPYPGRKEFDVHAAMYTARQVGGDFYDFYFVDEDTLAVLIADVSGKGIPAAMFMMQSKTLLKSCAESGMSVGQVLTTANEKLCQGNDAGMFVTAWMGLLNVKTGLLTFANAGHNPPLIKRADGSFEYLRIRSGFVLAGMEGIRYRENDLQLSPGDKLYLYTDGVTEAMDENEKLYGEERLLTLLNSRNDASAQEICAAVKDDVDAFVGEAEQFDDITMLCLCYNGTPRAGGGVRVKELTIAAAVENIEAATDFVNTHLDALGCPMKTRMQIDVAIDELLSNIARYAYHPQTGPVTIRVETQEEPRAVAVTFMDHGIPYNPLTQRDPDITLAADEREIGGLGVYLVKKSMDDVRYEYENGQNVLRIVKLLSV